MATCFKCNAKLSDTYKVMVSRSDTCPNCRADLRSCRMCQWYDPKSYNECRESNADRIVDKEKSNFCDYYKFSSGSNDAESERKNALAAAAALFRK